MESIRKRIGCNDEDGVWPEQIGALLALLLCFRS